MLFNSLKLIIANGLIYFLIAAYFTQKLGLTDIGKASLGILIGIIFCMISFGLTILLSHIIYPFISEIIYIHPLLKAAINTLLHIAVLITLFTLFKANNTVKETASKFTKCSIQSSNATVLGCLSLVVLMLMIIIFDPHLQLNEFIAALLGIMPVEVTLFFVISILVNLVICYNIVYFSTRNSFNDIDNRLHWRYLFIVLILMLMPTIILSSVIWFLELDILLAITNISGLLMFMLGLSLMIYVILGLSAHFAAKIVFSSKHSSIANSNIIT
ncbi:hypothetical protein [Orbus mooreae]|uniref:hypothetical protein n=1 Tax=Orbus mooreae TaxID=3074107 RepID=UPI00370D60AD